MSTPLYPAAETRLDRAAVNATAIDPAQAGQLRGQRESDSREAALDEALTETFPASDPVSPFIATPTQLKHPVRRRTGT